MKKSGRRVSALALCLAVLLLWAFLPRRLERSWDLLGGGMVRREARRPGEWGAVTSGPEMNLRAGTYRLSWRFRTDGENAVRLVSDNGADIAPARIDVSPQRLSGETVFTVFNETDNFNILAEYKDGTELVCEALSLRGGACTDTLFTLSFALLACALLLTLWDSPGFRQRMPMLAVVLFAALMASLPCLKDNLNLGDDMNFHLERLGNLTQGLMSGQFPVRLAIYMNRGFGSVTSVFYPETFLYPAAVMILMGASIQYAVHALLTAVNLLTALGAYRLGKRVFSDEASGVVCSVLYTLAIYRLTDLYTRSALGEALAMAVLPFFARELWEVLQGEQRRWPQLALAAAALLHTHLVTTAVTGCFSLLAAAACLIAAAGKGRREIPGRAGRLLAALAGAALLGLCLAAPMLTYLRQGIVTDVLQKDLAGNAMAPAQLLSQTGYDLGTKVWDRTLRSKGYETGVPLLLAALACLCVDLSDRAEGRRAGRGGKTAAFCLISGLCCLLAASRLFPWSALPERLEDAASFLQFPWRLLMLCDLLFALCGGWAARELAGEGTGRTRLIAALAALSLCLVSVMPMLTMETRKNRYVYYGRVSEQGMVFLDYALRGTDSRTLEDRSVRAEGVRAGKLRRAGTRLSLDLSESTGGVVTLPVFAFEGWAAELDGQALETGRSRDNRLEISVPAGLSGTLEVRFAGRPLWHAADGVSLAALIALSALALKRKGGGA